MLLSASVKAGSMMKGVVIKHPEAEPQRTDDLEKPLLEPDQILVRPVFIAIDPIQPRSHRFGKKDGDFEPGLGCDIAGIVVDVGEDVESSDFKIGDEVCGCVLCTSGQLGFPIAQEYFPMYTSLVMHKPKNVSMQQAATLGFGLFSAALAMTKEFGLMLPDPEEMARNKSTDFAVPRPSRKLVIPDGMHPVGQYATQLASITSVQTVTGCTASFVHSRWLEEWDARPFDKTKPIDHQLRQIVNILGKRPSCYVLNAGLGSAEDGNATSAIITEEALERCGTEKLPVTNVMNDDPSLGLADTEDESATIVPGSDVDGDTPTAEPDPDHASDTRENTPTAVSNRNSDPVVSEDAQVSTSASDTDPELALRPSAPTDATSDLESTEPANCDISDLGRSNQEASNSAASTPRVSSLEISNPDAVDTHTSNLDATNSEISNAGPLSSDIANKKSSPTTILGTSVAVDANQENASDSMATTATTRMKPSRLGLPDIPLLKRLIEADFIQPLPYDIVGRHHFHTADEEDKEQEQTSGDTKDSDKTGNETAEKCDHDEMNGNNSADNNEDQNAKIKDKAKVSDANDDEMNRDGFSAATFDRIIDAYRYQRRGAGLWNQVLVRV